MSRTTRGRLAAIGYLVCILAMIWPGALVANRITPYVLGLPFFMFWYVAWVFLLFVGLAVLYVAEHRSARHG